MALFLSLCFAILSVFALQASSSTDIPLYQQLLRIPPYTIPCDFPWGLYYDSTLLAHLNSIAIRKHVRFTDTITYYALADINIPTLPESNKRAISCLVSAEMYNEMIRRGIRYLPQLPKCSYPPNSFPFPGSNPDYPVPLPTPIDPTYPLPTPIDPTYPSTYDTLPEVDTLVRRSPLLPPNIGSYDMSSVEFELLMKNLFYGLESRTRNLSYQAILNIKEIVADKAPSDVYGYQSNILAYQLIASMKYSLAAAEQRGGTYPWLY